ncbi:hypothetical protein BCR42DRAFT_235341 [Absidia repens]|uniref:Uncharacterized protein n=1 Tax=Absidia repens TaxID=90262 RepID=A0A1X2IMG2_9FUNG|nr:hypothetical protein BCR42DRAFT_235341 [Absidia repens]
MINCYHFPLLSQVRRIVLSIAVCIFFFQAATRSYPSPIIMIKVQSHIVISISIYQYSILPSSPPTYNCSRRFRPEVLYNRLYTDIPESQLPVHINSDALTHTPIHPNSHTHRHKTTSIYDIKTHY